MAGIGRRGPAPQPVERKRALGNPGKRRLPAPVVALAPVVRVPASIAPRSGEEFVSAILETPASAWIAEPDRLGILAMVSDAWEERLALRADLAANGTSYTSYSKVAGEQRKLRPEVERLAVVEKQLTTWLSLLGLSPSDRSRLGVAEVKARSKLEELRARREARGLRAG